ncbi:hypothetical protein NDK43_06915 [Neobacillus pocheonensis]|uniref:MafI family immunity protein n=1 Tax=Neobacillus pocheonensis TaxID=363869 RepID=A0ABT0WAZ7_9BACI|nr:hypothetical protein [Neobacillus pocheonensis]
MKDLIKRAIRIALALAYNPDDEWLVSEYLDLCCDTGQFDNYELVNEVIAEEKAEMLIPIIYNLLKRNLAEELEKLEEQLKGY